MTNLDQSCSSLPSQAGGSQDNHDLPDSQIPVWRRNGKFVNFFRSFIGQKPKERAVKTPVVFGAELTKLLADTGDEGETPGIIYSVGNNQDFSQCPKFYEYAHSSSRSLELSMGYIEHQGSHQIYRE